jgi:hypothetical protein
MFCARCSARRPASQVKTGCVSPRYPWSNPLFQLSLGSETGDRFRARYEGASLV